MGLPLTKNCECDKFRLKNTQIMEMRMRYEQTQLCGFS